MDAKHGNHRRQIRARQVEKDAVVRQHTSDFLVTESNGKWYLRTTQRRVLRQVAVLFVGGVFMIGGGVWMDFGSTDDPLAWWRDSHVFTILGCLTAILLWGVGIWVWWIRHLPVSIDTETVRYTLATGKSANRVPLSRYCSVVIPIPTI